MFYYLPEEWAAVISIGQRKGSDFGEALRPWEDSQEAVIVHLNGDDMLQATCR